MEKATDQFSATPTSHPSGSTKVGAGDFCINHPTDHDDADKLMTRNCCQAAADEADVTMLWTRAGIAQLCSAAIRGVALLWAFCCAEMRKLFHYVERRFVQADKVKSNVWAVVGRRR
jgi:hypothetical protein